MTMTTRTSSDLRSGAGLCRLWPLLSILLLLSACSSSPKRSSAPPDPATVPRLDKADIVQSPQHLIAGDRVVLVMKNDDKLLMRVKELRGEQLCSITDNCVSLDGVKTIYLQRVSEERRLTWIELVIEAAGGSASAAPDLSRLRFRYPSSDQWTLTVSSPQAPMYIDVALLDTGAGGTFSTAGAGGSADLGGGLLGLGGVVAGGGGGASIGGVGGVDLGGGGFSLGSFSLSGGGGGSVTPMLLAVMLLGGGMRAWPRG